MSGQPRSHELGARVVAEGATSWTFTGRPGGVSAAPYEALNVADHVGDDPTAVARNRALLAGALGLPASRLAIMQAAHGADVAVARDGRTYPNVDILVTQEIDLALVALSADCATIVMVDPQAGVIGAVHSGWRGLAADAPGAAVTAMASLGADPARIVADVGPVICPACYEVSQEVQDQVAAAAPAVRATTREGTPSIDLHAGVREQLGRAGVATTTFDPACTAESDDLYSHRADGRTGRQAAAIVLGPPEDR